MTCRSTWIWRSFCSSGDAIPSQVQRVLDLGAAAYITKPFDIQELLQLVDTKLEERARAER